MTGLHRTPLTTPRKIECVVKALAGQEALGGIAALSREFGISRPTIYAAKEVASEVLRERNYSLDSHGALPNHDFLATQSRQNLYG